MTRGPPVQRLRDHRLARVDRANAKLGARLLQQNLVRPERGRLLEHAVRCAANAFWAARDANQPLRLVVVRRNVRVTDWPIPTETVVRPRLQVVIGVAQLEASVVIRASANDARSEPAEGAAGCNGVGFIL